MRITLTFQLEARTDEDITAVKEALAMTLERWGDVRLLWLGRPAEPEQISLDMEKSSVPRR